MRNDFYQEKEVVLSGEIVDRDGKAVKKYCLSTMLPAAELSTVENCVEIENPKLWSPDTPYLYSLRVCVFEHDEKVDIYETKFGFRTFYVDSEQGLFINAKHYLIKGVCGHADCGIFGKAVPDSVQRYKVRLLKEMGANGYRTSHYMQSESFMDALDENGFIVMDETRWFSSEEESVKQLTALVKRDRNRPSVFFWSVGNEEPHHTTETGRKIYKKLANVVKNLDSSRLVTTAVSYDPDTATVYDECDVIGINYNWKSYDEIHKKYPNMK